MTVSAWAPLRRSAFRALWLAQFASNIGTWAQTVGAQWLMGDLGGSALQVALVQTATTLPVFLLVVPSGALGDILDRRHVLISGQALMLAGAAGLMLLAGTDKATPSSLLGLLALMAIGQALSMPSFQAIQPELVSREEIPQAALLNGVNMNVGRAIGPALGGLLIALAGSEATFAFNTVSFLGVLIVLARWKRPSDHRPLGTEHITSAVRTGARYVASSPLFRRVLVRLLLFIVFGSGLWALLPAIARGPLQLDASGYGVLLGSVGAGAIGGAFVVPKLLQRMSKNRLVLFATWVYAGATSTAVLTESFALVIVAMLLTGACWIATLSTFNATAQVMLPSWTRARALAYYQLILMGGQALGAVVWGVIADAYSLKAAMIVPAAAMAIGVLAATKWLPLLDRSLDISPATYWDAPPEIDDTDAGPVLVTVEWPVAKENEDDFIDAMQKVGQGQTTHRRDDVGAVPGHGEARDVPGDLHGGDVAGAPEAAHRARHRRGPAEPGSRTCAREGRRAGAAPVVRGAAQAELTSPFARLGQNMIRGLVVCAVVALTGGSSPPRTPVWPAWAHRGEVLHQA